MPDHVNGCITRAASDGSVTVVASAPTVAQATLTQSTSVALGLSAAQAAEGQVLANAAQQATLLSGVATLFAIDTAALAASIRKLETS